MFTMPADFARTDRVRFEESLYRILDAAIDADYAMLGNIQLLNHGQNALQIVAQRGFDQAFLNHFESVRDNDGSVCSRAFTSRQRVMISDVQVDPAFAPHRSIARSNGFRAVQSTPVFSRGVFRGVLSTHFPAIHRLTERASDSLDRRAAEIGKLLEQFGA